VYKVNLFAILLGYINENKEDIISGKITVRNMSKQLVLDKSEPLKFKPNELEESKTVQYILTHADSPDYISILKDGINMTQSIVISNAYLSDKVFGQQEGVWQVHREVWAIRGISD
jgi:hypothetical protein